MTDIAPLRMPTTEQDITASLTDFLLPDIADTVLGYLEELCHKRECSITMPVGEENICHICGKYWCVLHSLDFPGYKVCGQTQGELHMCEKCSGIAFT